MPTISVNVGQPVNFANVYYIVSKMAKFYHSMQHPYHSSFIQFGKQKKTEESLIMLSSPWALTQANLEMHLYWSVQMIHVQNHKKLTVDSLKQFLTLIGSSWDNNLCYVYDNRNIHDFIFHQTISPCFHVFCCFKACLLII